MVTPRRTKRSAMPTSAPDQKETMSAVSPAVNPKNAPRLSSKNPSPHPIQAPRDTNEIPSRGAAKRGPAAKLQISNPKLQTGPGFCKYMSTASVAAAASTKGYCQDILVRQ